MTKTPENREFSYQPRPNWIRMVVFFILAGGLVWLGNAVLTGLFSTLAFGLGVGVLVGGVIGLGLLIWIRLYSPRRIVLTDSSIRLPKSMLSSVEVEIPFERVKGAERQTEKRPPLGIIEHCALLHQDGTTKINKKWLSTPQEFEDIVGFLESKGIAVVSKSIN